MGAVAKTVLFACCATALVGIAWSFYAFTKQVDAWIVLDFYSRQLQRMRAEDGRYPATFHVRYRQGQSIAYLHNDDHFVLVSFGSDGLPDRSDYRELLSVARTTGGRRNCWQPALDTVVVDGATWQGCTE